MILDNIFRFFSSNRKKLTVHMIDEVSQLLPPKRVKYLANRFHYKPSMFAPKGEYMVDEKAHVYFKGTPHAFYYLGNPSPIILRHRRSDLTITAQKPDGSTEEMSVDAVAFKKILDNKAIEDLMKPKTAGYLVILIVLVAISLILTAAVLLVDLKVIKVAGAA